MIVSKINLGKRIGTKPVLRTMNSSMKAYTFEATQAKAVTTRNGLSIAIASSHNVMFDFKGNVLKTIEDGYEVVDRGETVYVNMYYRRVPVKFTPWQMIRLLLGFEI